MIYHRVRDAAARANAAERAEMESLIAGAERLHDSVAPPRLLVQKFPAFLRLLD